MEKVLIITYYWPPAGGPGVQRWLKFAKYLRDFHVEPVVYVPENPNYPIIDKSFQEEVPEGIEVIKKKIFEPYSIAGIFSRKNTETISSGIIQNEKDQSVFQRFMLYIRGNYFIPDARKFWIRPSVRFLQKRIRKGEFKAIITTGPPHSLHLIGLKLQKATGIKWIADFRDPWTQIGYHNKLKLNRRSRERHIELEKKVLNAADHIITTSFTTRDEFVTKTDRPVTVITNGFDEEVCTSPASKSYFEISHIGSLLSGRNPHSLWKILKELVEENTVFRDKFRLRLAGKISGEVLECIREHALEPYMLNEGYVNHSTAIRMQREASVLLLIEIDSEETRGIIPGKLFEYLASGRPILGIGPEKWDAANIMTDTAAGRVFKYQDELGIKNYIEDLFVKFQNEEVGQTTRNIEKYHRKALTAKLANLIKEVSWES